MKSLFLIFSLLTIGLSLLSGQNNQIKKLKWINFSPYVNNGQNPDYLSQIPESQIVYLIDSLLPYTEGIRTFGTTHGLERAPYIAKQKNLKVIVGIWLSSDTTVNRQQIESGIKIATDGMADRIIVGSEVLLRNQLPVNKIIDYINEVKTACPGIPVSYADITSKIINNPKIIDACDFVSVNIYPFWEGVPIDCAIKSLHQSSLSVQAIAKGKEVFISETGWKTDGNPFGEAIPSVPNSVRYLKETLNWSKASGIEVNLFSAFEEPWKVQKNDGGWGIFNSEATLKPGMEKIFEPITRIDTTWLCNQIISQEKDTLSIDYLPVIGSFQNIEGHISHINPCDYRIAGYIYVKNFGWVTKPTYENPSVPINCLGKWSLDYTTGGTDQLATDIRLFLIPAGYSPPLVGGGNVFPGEIYQKALARKFFHRDSLKTARLEATADTVCLRESVTLTAYGGKKYLWNTGDTSASIVVIPLGGSNTYSVEISDLNGNGQVISKHIFTIDEFISIDPPYYKICMGDSVTLSIHPATSAAYVNYVWSTGQTSSTIKVSPNVSSEYSLTGYTGKGCHKTVSCKVEIDKGPGIHIFGDSICYGNSSYLYTYGGKSYLWSTGDTTSYIYVNPKYTQSYTVTLTNFNNCKFVFKDSVYVNPLASVSAFPDTISYGEISMLSAKGGDGSNFYWSTGENNPSIQVKPEKTTTYIVTVKNKKLGCSETLNKTVFVKTGPVFSPDTLNLHFNTGWSIFSTNVIPDSSDLKVLFKPLINNGKLVKIQDESGRAMEDYGFLGGWINNIGKISLTKGYKIKVIENCQLTVTGKKVTFPYKIPLKHGWNIMGYPVNREIDGMEVVQQLIDQGKLIKIQDGKGVDIENYGVFGGWKNNIGFFRQGQGYKVKMSADDTLTVGIYKDCTDPDGNIYKTVQIGNQVWMAENLKTTKYRDGSAIPHIMENSIWGVLSTGAYCLYNNDSTNKNIYGALYNWHAVSTSKLCPVGWHVPDNNEWTTLENYLIANGYNYDSTTSDNKIAKSLASTTYWISSTVRGSVGNMDFPAFRNKTGFSALPAGYRDFYGTFNQACIFTEFWSSTETSVDNAWLRGMCCEYAYLFSSFMYKTYGHSVRCVQDH
jgi:uncharacterized protein (TIGR02145 family)